MPLVKYILLYPVILDQEHHTVVIDTSVSSDKLGGKRKAGSRPESAARRSKHPAYFIPELAHVVAMCDERLPYVSLAQEVIFHFI